MTRTERQLINGLAQVRLGLRPGVVRMVNYLTSLAVLDPDKVLTTGQADFMWAIAYRYRGQLKSLIPAELLAQVVATGPTAKVQQPGRTYYATATPKQLRAI